MDKLDEADPGDPVPEVFPPDDPVARFVVSMTMAARFDRAMRDVLRAGDNDDPDFSYRVRLSVRHLVEALDSLRSYSEELTRSELWSPVYRRSIDDSFPQRADRFRKRAATFSRTSATTRSITRRRPRGTPRRRTSNYTTRSPP